MAATFANITVTLGTSYAQPFLVLGPNGEPYSVAQNTGAIFILQVTNGPVTILPATSFTVGSQNTATGLVVMNLASGAFSSVPVGVYDYTFIVILSDGTQTEQANGKFIVNSQTQSNIATPNTTWTFTGLPDVSELTLYAFYQAGLRGTSLTQEHLQSARTAATLMLGRWNTGANLWAIDQQTIQIGEGFSQYTVPANTIAILDAYMTNSNGNNRIITPMSRTEWASISNPSTVGVTTSFWFDRLLSPTLNLWPVPSGQEPTLTYYRIRQIQDPTLVGGKNVEMPIYYLEAFALGMAFRLATIWKPEKAASLKALYDEAKAEADSQNIEVVPMYISPMLGGYYRN